DGVLAGGRDADAARRRVQHHQRDLHLLERRAGTLRHLERDRRLYPARSQRERFGQLPLLSPRGAIALVQTVVRLAAALLAGAALASPVLAHPPIAGQAPSGAQASFEADRADILAMAGDFKVRFDMQEATSWRAGYEPLERKLSGGHESVRVIED